MKQEAGKHTTEECCGNLNVGMFMYTSSLGQENKYLCFGRLLLLSESKNKNRKGV